MYTESQLNSTPERKISEECLPLYFASDLYNVLIVADKYQTGFDERNCTQCLLTNG